MGKARGVICTVAVLTFPAVSLAAPKTAAAPASASATTQPAAAPDPSAAPAPTDTAPPVDTAPPPPVDTAPPPPPAPAPAAQAPASDDIEDEAPRRRHKKKRRHLDEEEDEESTGDSENEWGSRESGDEVAPSGGFGWRLAGTHFILSAERLTSVLSWTRTDTLKISGFSSGGFATSSETIELETSGTDVSFLTTGSRGNLYGTPRVAFDGMFSNGFTLGGSLGYVVMSGKHEEPDFTSSGSIATSKHSVDDATIAVFVFAPRLGVMITPTPTLGIWLRGGITRVSAATDGNTGSDIDGNPVSRSTTVTLLAVTLDPQLVFVPVPRVGITLGPVLDIGASGSVDVTEGSTTDSRDVKMSSFGVAGGLALIF